MNSDADLGFIFALHIIDVCAEGRGQKGGEGGESWQQLHHDNLTECFDNYDDECETIE